jgi:hypothetical protein
MALKREDWRAGQRAHRHPRLGSVPAIVAAISGVPCVSPWMQIVCASVGRYACEAAEHD